MRCKRCGAQLRQGSKFCRQCGEPVRPRRTWPIVVAAVSLVLLAVCIAFIVLVINKDAGAPSSNNQPNSTQVDEPTPNAPTTDSETIQTYERTYESYQRVVDVSREIEISFVDEDGYISYERVGELLQSLESALRNDPDIESITNNGSTLTVTLVGTNAKVVYEPPLPDAAQNGENYSVITCEPYLRDHYYKARVEGTNQITIENTKRDPKTASGESLIDDTGRYVSSQLPQYSFDESSNFDNETVSPRMFRGVSDHQLVILNGHGGASETVVYIGTGISVETVNWPSASFDEEYCRDWIEGRLYTSTSGHILIPSTYFEYDSYFPDGCFNGSIFFLGTCDTLINDSLGQALVGKGAKLVVGSNETIQSNYLANMISTMLRHMSEINPDTRNYYTVSEALSFGEAINNIEGSGFDRYPGRMDFYPRSAGETRLADATAPADKGPENPPDDTTTGNTAAKRDIALVLDVSGSMAGDPLEATKNAASRFVNVALDNGAQTALVAYDDDAEVLSDFTTDEAHLKGAIGQLSDKGGTDMDSGLTAAADLLAQENADSQFIVLMSDGQPNDGKTGKELIAYAESIRDPDHDGTDDVIIYTLGFNEDASGQELLRAIASDGCYTSVHDAADLEYFFQEMVDGINGVKFMYARIACPVDVSVTFDGETLDSSGDSPRTRASFGSLTFEENENGDSDDPVKVLRLREGQSYDIAIKGTGFGTMDYSIGFKDDEGHYSDFRTFSGIEITDQTAISTTAEATEATTLAVDEDGDGTVDKTYRARANQEGELVDNSWVARIIVTVFATLALGAVGVVLWRAFRRHLARVDARSADR